jgi:hypothetical protein
MLRVALLLVLLTVAGFAGSIYSGIIRIPDHFDPWAPLRIEHPLNWLTRYKLARLEQDGATCLDVLAGASLRYTPMPDREIAPGCTLQNVVRVEASRVQVSRPFALSCRAAVSFALWEHHVVQPAAQQSFGKRVARLEHAGSFACRNVNGSGGARRSRHATADALDVDGFVLADGKRVRVLHAWNGGEQETSFLRVVHAGACKLFDGVLGPDYDAAHRDHFHLERGGRRYCR